MVNSIFPSTSEIFTFPSADKNSFDLKAIRNSDLKLAYDSMFGAGKNVISRLLPETLQIHADDNPGFYGQAPEPIHRNLLEFSDFIKTNGNQ